MDLQVTKAELVKLLTVMRTDEVLTELFEEDSVLWARLYNHQRGLRFLKCSTKPGRGGVVIKWTEAEPEDC